MTAAVLCPGPSLAKLDPARIQCGASIAVNRAILHHPAASWWCFGDDRIYRDTPATVTRVCTWARNHPALRPGTMAVSWEVMREFYPCGDDGWTVFSATAALILAATLGAERIEVYGADMVGTADYDGHRYTYPGETAEDTRSEARWDRERLIWDEVVVTLDGKGIEVIHK